MRVLTAEVAAACAAQRVAPAYLVEMLFDSGPLRVWSGVGNFDWTTAGKIFTGVGTYGGISEVEETRKVAANGIELSLSGIPSEMVSLVLTENYRNRRVYVWLAFFDLDTSALLADPVPIFAGRMDTMRLKDTGATSTVSVSCESKLIDMERARERRYTNEDQKERYPEDRGLEYVARLQEKELFWGRSRDR